jgi:CheY-like chemotaxis protein
MIPRSILCVDDDLDDLMFLREAINHIDNGYQVVELRNGIEADQLPAPGKSR